MSEIKPFTEVTSFWFHYGGTVILPKDKNRRYKTINETIVEKGWRLVGGVEMAVILNRYKKFLYKEDRYLIGTKESSIFVVESGDNAGIIVPAIKSTDNDLIFHEKFLIPRGLIPDHSDICILAIK